MLGLWLRVLSKWTKRGPRARRSPLVVGPNGLRGSRATASVLRPRGSSWQRLAYLSSALLVGACGDLQGAELHGRVQLALLHTSDLHSRLLPFPWRVGTLDARLGLGEVGEVREVGGFARLGGAVRRELLGTPRALYFDCGDALSGGIAFELFGGEPELRALSHMGLSAQAIGNHEFDHGREALVATLEQNARFPVLATNYLLANESGEARWLGGFTVVHADGLRVGVLGAGNRSSLRELSTQPNSLGIVPLSEAEAVQRALDWLRPNVDVIVLLSHLGLDGDEALIRRTSGLDVVLGGHNHLAFDQARTVFDCSEAQAIAASRGAASEGAEGLRGASEPDCQPRPVLLLHSGAYGRFLGRLELALSDLPEDQTLGSSRDDGFEVIDFRSNAVPITSDVPEDPGLAALLAPYVEDVSRYQGLDALIGYVPKTLAQKTDAPASALRNLVARALRQRFAGRAEIAMLQTSALRGDVREGPLTSEALYVALPFEDRAAVYHLTGKELGEVLGEVSSKTRERGCAAQIAVDGAKVHFDCACESPLACSPKLFVARSHVACQSDDDCESGVCFEAARGCGRELTPEEVVSVATTGYFAKSYAALGRHKPVEAAEGLREVVAEWMRAGEGCVDSAACSETLATWIEQTCREKPCEGADAASLARALCSALPCIDEQLGAVSDDRVKVQR